MTTGLSMPDAIALSSLAGVIITGLCAVIVAIVKFIPPKGLRNGNAVALAVAQVELKAVQGEIAELRRLKHKAMNILQRHDVLIDLLTAHTGVEINEAHMRRLIEKKGNN